MGAANAIDTQALLSALAERARSSGRFASVRAENASLVCEAPRSAAPAHFRLSFEADGVWAALVTPDRYLSQSIEQDLVHTGDKLGDLLRDELIDLGHPAPYTPVVEHFRDSQKLFTFRSRVPATDLSDGGGETQDRLWITLCAYQACFNNLGDVDGDEADE